MLYGVFGPIYNIYEDIEAFLLSVESYENMSMGFIIRYFKNFTEMLLTGTKTEIYVII